MDAARAEAKRERDSLLIAYGDVFGREEGGRSEQQKRVWEDMMRRGFVRRPTAHVTEGAGVDLIASSHNEGKRLFMLDCMEAVHQAGLLARGGDHVTARKQSRKFKA